MYNFSKNKLLKLPPTNQASKMALLLKSILESPERDERVVKEYEKYMQWIKPSFLPLDADALDEQYHYWNAASGHSRGLINTKRVKDRRKNLKPQIPWTVALNSMRSGYNVGSVIRTADAFGFTEVLLGGNTPNSDNRALQSSAMGAEQWIKQTPVSHLFDFIKKKRESGIQIIGLELASDAIPLSRLSIATSGLLIIGNEEKGIEHRIRKLCHNLVYIPMYGKKHSLNVSAAFAIAAHYIRQNHSFIPN
jgi:tRNA G18 (ribose-2'-O)-methylase SpoU